MFAIKRETDYAIQLIRYLNSKKDKYSSLREFSKQSKISFWFLQKIARKLTLAKVIKAEQGVNGGYKLAIAPSKLNMYTIFEVMEGKLALTPCCLGNHSECANGKNKCAVRTISLKLNKDIIKILQKVRVTA